jgi:hypothetical protein
MLLTSLNGNGIAAIAEHPLSSNDIEAKQKIFFMGRFVETNLGNIFVAVAAFIFSSAAGEELGIFIGGGRYTNKLCVATYSFLTSNFSQLPYIFKEK